MHPSVRQTTVTLGPDRPALSAQAVAYQSFFQVRLVRLVRLHDQRLIDLEGHMRFGQRGLQRRDAGLFTLHHHLHDVAFRLEAPVLVQPLLEHRDAGLRVPRGLAQRELTRLHLRDQPLLQLLTVLMKRSGHWSTSPYGMTCRR